MQMGFGGPILWKKLETSLGPSWKPSVSGVAVGAHHAPVLMFWPGRHPCWVVVAVLCPLAFRVRQAPGGWVF